MSISGTAGPATSVHPDDASRLAGSPGPRRGHEDAGSSEPSALWKVGSLNPSVVKALTVLGFAVPALAYLFVLQRYHVNAIVQDQWDDIAVIRQNLHHFPDWSSLWRQHTDNRILFPNLIVLFLAYTVHFNVIVEEYLSAGMLFSAAALIIWTHKRRSPGVPLLYYCPVAFLTLTLAQWQNMLWGFQMAWFLVLLAVAGALFLLDRPKFSGWVLAAAAGVAVVASYSSLQGLLIWPVGLVLLYHRNRPRWAYVSWLSVALVTTSLYFVHYHNQTTESLKWVARFPLRFVEFYVFALGDIVGVPVKTETAPANPAVVVFGSVLLVLAVLSLIKWGIRRDETSGGPLGIALVVYALLFVVMITQGRFFFGFFAASQSRYTTNSVLALTGIYLTALSAVTSGVASRPTGTKWSSATGLRRALSRVWERIDGLNGRIILGVSLAAVVIQVVSSAHYAPAGARYNHQQGLTVAAVTRNIDHVNDYTVWVDLYIAQRPTVIRSDAHFLRQQHLSQFG